MVILKALHDFFNLIEPFLVVIVFIFQIYIFFVLKKKQIIADSAFMDLKTNAINWLNDFFKNHKEISKEKLVPPESKKS